MTTTNTKMDLAHKIANEHGVDILPTAVGGRALQVQGRYRKGDIEDRELIAKVRAKIEASGISTDGWLS